MNEVVKAIVHYNDKVLVLTRFKKSNIFPGSLDLPGGKVEKGETPKQAIIREIYEETGIKVKKTVPIRAWSFNLKSHGKLVTGNTFYCRVEAPNVQLSDEHTKYEWVNISEIFSTPYPTWLRKDVELVPYVNCI